MKRLYIARHAQKSEEEYENDYDRPLTQKGLNDAKMMAEKLANEGVIFDAILASPAQRTRQTAEIFAKELGYHKNIIYNQTLYMGYVNEVKEVLSYTYDEVETLLLVGHNPSLTALCITLNDEFREKMQMGSIVQLEFDCVSWLDISKSNARFISYDYPKE